MGERISIEITKEEFQKLVLEYNLLKNLIDELQRRTTFLMQFSNEINKTLEALKGIDEAKDKLLLLPLGGIVFLRVKGLDKERILLKIGANIIIEKPLNYALDYLTRIRDAVGNELANLNRSLNEAVVRYKQIGEIISSVSPRGAS